MTFPYPIPEIGHGALYGQAYEPRYLAKVFYEAGWQDAETLMVALCVYLAESQGRQYAIHHNINGTFDRGPWQLNSIHKGATDEVAYDLVKATAFAFDLYVEADSSFKDWKAYLTQVYLHDSYVGRAARGVGNYLADEMLKVDVPGYKHAFETPILDYRFRLAQTKYHVGIARRELGWNVASVDKVRHVQEELANAQRASTPGVPPA